MSVKYGVVKVMKNEKIQELISCPKIIVEKPRRTFKIKGMHKENEFVLRELDSDTKFVVRMRKHTEFIENFSIMLEFYSRELEKDIKLVRFNGPHLSIHRNMVINNNTWTHKSHIHIATWEAIEAGYSPENYAEVTEEYQIFSEALISFWKRVNIVDSIDKYFPNIKQSSTINKGE